MEPYYKEPVPKLKFVSYFLKSYVTCNFRQTNLKRPVPETLKIFRIGNLTGTSKIKKVPVPESKPKAPTHALPRPPALLSRIRGRRRVGPVDGALKQHRRGRRRQLQHGVVVEPQLQLAVRERAVHAVVIAAHPGDREHDVQVDGPVQHVREHAARRRPGYV